MNQKSKSPRKAMKSRRNKSKRKKSPRKPATSTPYGGTKSILAKRITCSFRVYNEGVDVTPEPLNYLAFGGLARERQVSVYDTTGAEITASTEQLKLFQSGQSTSRFHSQLYRQTIQGETLIDQFSSYADDIVIEPVTADSPTGSLFDSQPESPQPPEELKPMELDVPKKMVQHVSLVLSETSTIFLFELPSKTVEKDTEEGTTVEEANARYAFLTEGKGRNRKVVHAEVQTTQILLKTRTTEAERPQRKHNHAFASNWDMYDTYFKANQKEEALVAEFLEEEKKGKPFHHRPPDRPRSGKSPKMDDDQIIKLMQNARFLEAVCVTERLLANNNFNEQQKRFRGLCDPDPFREDIEYKYRLDLLWTFANDVTKGRCVSAMCTNEANTDVLAVGYGKFFYKDNTPGLVMIWNVKNPVQPERVYRFDSPVTTLNFSKQNPNVLAVGFYDGTIKLLDISSREVRVIGKSSKDSPSFEPVWQVSWYAGSDYFKDEEQVVVACQDGRITRYRMQDTVELIDTQIMRIPRPEGKLKGIETLRRCHVPGIPVTRYAAALVIQDHPADPNIYYVGTSEGTIHKCSRIYYHQHLDLFLAHDGPLYILKFSPFCDRVFLTCGDDWNVRIWAEGISEPLFELSKMMLSVQGADWCPTHSTIVANICGTDIYVWDLQRKTHLPQSVTTSPTKSRNTVIQFAESGRCLLVGDIEGNVHVFALEDMPFAAFFQDDLLSTSIHRGLVTRPELVRQIKKLGGLSFDRETLVE